MNNQFQVLGYQLNQDIDVQLHSHQELQTLVKKKVISKDILQYNHKLNEYLNLSKNRGQNSREEDIAQRKKIVKDLNKMSQLSEIDKIMIMNNKYASQAELMLKVPAAQNLSTKDRKHIVESLK